MFLIGYVSCISGSYLNWLL